MARTPTTPLGSWQPETRQYQASNKRATRSLAKLAVFARWAKKHKRKKGGK